MAEKESVKRLAVNEQNGDVLYEMELKFILDVELKEVNNIMSSFGFDDKVELKDAVTVTMRQIVPFIPDADAIAKYTETMKKNYLKNSKEFACTNCKFCGYNYLYAVEVTEA